MGLRNTFNLRRINRLYDWIRKLIDNPELRNDPNYWIEFKKRALKVKEVREMLQGYKTYIVGALIVVVSGLHAMGYIDDATRDVLLQLLGAGAVGTVAAKINRINNKIR